MTTIMTVTGPISSDQLGITLPHEHLFNDVSSWFTPASLPGWGVDEFAAAPVTMDILWDLKQAPFGNRDNCRLDDASLAAAEIARFRDLGGTTIFDVTSLGTGRDLARLADLSRATGVTIVAGTGYYLDSSQPAEVKGLGPEQIAQRLIDDVTLGDDGVRPGILGEIGVSADFTPAERASLEGALLAQLEVELPLEVHLPGWFRRGGEVLDIAERIGVDPSHIVLCHMGPSGDDLPYQLDLLQRGAWLQYDMIGMDVFYDDQGVQCPSDEQNAAWLCRLADRGHLDKLLVSHDIFLKSLLRHYGGPGYGHILQYFGARLRRHGMTETDLDRLWRINPRSLFENVKEK